MKRGTSSQVWSMEKLENKIIDMRELYEDHQSKGDLFNVSNFKLPLIKTTNFEISF